MIHSCDPAVIKSFEIVYNGVLRGRRYAERLQHGLIFVGFHHNQISERFLVMQVLLEFSLDQILSLQQSPMMLLGISSSQKFLLQLWIFIHLDSHYF